MRKLLTVVLLFTVLGGVASFFLLRTKQPAGEAAEEVAPSEEETTLTRPQERQSPSPLVALALAGALADRANERTPVPDTPPEPESPEQRAARLEARYRTTPLGNPALESRVAAALTAELGSLATTPECRGTRCKLTLSHSSAGAVQAAVQQLMSSPAFFAFGLEISWEADGTRAAVYVEQAETDKVGVQ